MIHILDEVPRTATGKLQRRRIAARFVEPLMRFAVVGAGAIGAYVGAALARGGADVTLIARGAHLRAMQEHGVRVQSPRGDFDAHPAATDDFDAIGDADVIFLALKAHSLPELADRIGAALAPRRGGHRRAERHPLVVLPAQPGPLAAPRWRASTPTAGSRRRSTSSA